MSKRPEYTFFQRGHTDGQQAHEEVLNIANHQGNANHNLHEISLEISLHTLQDAYHQK